MAEQSAYLARPSGVELDRARQHGWGAGWPNCQRKKMKRIVFSSGVQVEVRGEIAELVAVLLEATEKVHGYRLRADSTGGFACREIRDSHPPAPSNHSWGLAVDINWHDNPRGLPFRCNLPVPVVPMWFACGFFWGGWYRRSRVDPMHFEYVFRPGDVAGHLATAKIFLEGDHMPNPLRNDDDFRALIFRLEGLLSMRDTVNNHVNNPAEPNQLARAIREAAGQAKAAADQARLAADQARLAAEQAKTAAEAAQRAAGQPVDQAVIETIVAGVVQRVLTQLPARAQPVPPAAPAEPAPQ
jgi:D-alanyl-D-alanine carboxypeptidase